MNHRGPSAEGVRAKPKSRIQFDFVLDGVRYRPTIRSAPTAQNLLAARERLVGIRQRIRAGTFFFDQEFPNCQFLRRVLNALWRPRIGARHFLRVDYVMLARVADSYRCNKKTFNNAVSVHRRAFAVGYRNHPQHMNPSGLSLRGGGTSRLPKVLVATSKTMSDTNDCSSHAFAPLDIMAPHPSGAQ